MINALFIIFLLAANASAATVTKVFAEFGGSASPKARVLYTYDDVSNKVQQVQVFKSTNENLCAQVQELPAGSIDAKVFTHNTGTVTLNVPQNGGNSVTLQFDGRGRPKNMEGQVMFPYIGTQTPCQ